MRSLELGARAEAMIAALGAISDDPDHLTRLYLSPAHRRAIDVVADWMRDAGLTTRVDSLGTVHGLLRSTTGGDTPRLLIGSHIDTVVDAGSYDGALGVVAGILAASEIGLRQIALPFALEVLAFGDEEGVRFPMTLSSSRAIAGAFDLRALDAADGKGTTLRDALVSFGGDPALITIEGYRAADVVGYLEVHIEQGPVLEQEGEALAVVSAIAGQARYRVTVTGETGHAGTVPMALRRDALAAAAEMITTVEAKAREGDASLVATVGEIVARPGAVNVIPGQAIFSLDIRAADDGVRVEAVAALRSTFAAIAARRQVAVDVTVVHEKAVTLTDIGLNQMIAAAIADVTGHQPRSMMSGAGHDGQALASLTGVGMIFVRCRGGVSHDPREFAAAADMGLAVEALTQTIARLAAAPSLSR